MAASSVYSFLLQRERPLPVLHGQLREYLHPSGAALIHVAVPDLSLTLSVSFRTPPENDDGRAHVLEHMVLLGSQASPSPLAFAEVQRWTLLDYLNASTTPDWTAFTVSSRSVADLCTAGRFFLNAVFHPLLSEEIFRQEAWRFGPDGQVSGVIYNEMGGALGHPSRRMRAAVSAALFPGTTYAHQAGGTQAGLLRLDLGTVRAFHAQHYVPANAVFYLYGDGPLSEIAALLDGALQGLEPGRAQPLPRPCNQGLPQLTITHPRSAQTLLAWAMPADLPAAELQAMNVLALTLLGHPHAPLCRAMRTLGGELADGTGFHADTAQPVLAIGCLAEVTPERLLHAALTCLAEPLLQEDVEAALGRYALSALDTQHNGFPYGVQLSFDVLGAQHHGQDPYPGTLGGALDALRAHPDLTGHLQGLAHRYLSDNLHRTVVLMRQAEDSPESGPDEDPDKRAKRLAAPVAPASSLVIQFPGDPVPGPARSGSAQRRVLAAAPSAAELVRQDLLGRSVESAQVPGPLTQASLSRDLCDLSDCQLAALPVYVAALPHSDLGRALTLRLRTLGAQWSVNLDTTHDPHDPAVVRASLTLNLRGLGATFADTLRVLGRGWLHGSLATAGLESVLQARCRQLDSRVPQEAPQYAMLQAALRANPGMRLREAFDGLHSHALLRTGAGNSELLAGLGALHKALWSTGRLQALIVGDDAPEALALQLTPLFAAMAEQATTGLAAFPVGAGTEAEAELTGTGLTGTPRVSLPTTAAWALPTVPYAHPDAGLLTVLGSVLHERLYIPVRAEGGAYGVTARTLPEAGLLLMVSARDPQPERTRQLFERAADLVSPLSGTEIQAARLSAYRQTMPLRSLAMLTRQAALDRRTGYSLERRAQYCQTLLSASRKDLLRVAESYLLPYPVPLPPVPLHPVPHSVRPQTGGKV